MLELVDIHSYYGNIHALHGVSLTVQKGEVVTLIGANGAGKSTTLLSICGIVPIQAGKVLFEESNISKKRPDLIVQSGISLVPEGRRIFPELTVSENLDMGAYLRTDTVEIKADLAYVFSLFPVLAERKSQLGGTLSGGEQQMLAIARALMARPRMLLLDEPSLGLAPKLITQIFSALEQIRKQHQTTIFLVEQNAFQALKVADRGYVMENGRIAISGPAAELADNETVKKAYLGI